MATTQLDSAFLHTVDMDCDCKSASINRPLCNPPPPTLKEKSYTTSLPLESVIDIFQFIFYFYQLSGNKQRIFIFPNVLAVNYANQMEDWEGGGGGGFWENREVFSFFFKVALTHTDDDGALGSCE